MDRGSGPAGFVGGGYAPRVRFSAAATGSGPAGFDGGGYGWAHNQFTLSITGSGPAGFDGGGYKSSPGRTVTGSGPAGFVGVIRFCKPRKEFTMGFISSPKPNLPNLNYQPHNLIAQSLPRKTNFGHFNESNFITSPIDNRLQLFSEGACLGVRGPDHIYAFLNSIAVFVTSFAHPPCASAAGFRTNRDVICCYPMRRFAFRALFLVLSLLA